MSKYTELKKRLLAGFGGAAVIASALVFSEWTYFIIFLLISVLVQWEFYGLIKLKRYKPVQWLGVLIGGGIFVFSFLVERQHWSANYYYILFPLASLVFLIKLYKKNDNNPFLSIALYYLGIIYVAIPFSLINILVFVNGDYSYQIIIGLLLIIWASDSGAYFAGKYFGKTKLFERISPKKSWEGILGGTFLSFAMAYGHTFYLKELDLISWFAIATIVIIAGTYGDLVESFFKRSMSIKDSGSVIPGHGGFLDRFDSLILAVPFIVVFLKLF